MTNSTVDREHDNKTTVMNGMVESPFFKAFATTNSLLLGAGALYLVSFGRESSLNNTGHDTMLQVVQEASGRNQKSVNGNQKYTEWHGNFLYFSAISVI